MTEANCKKRLQFAKEHTHWSLDHWKRVMWSDGSRFTLFRSDGKKRGGSRDAHIMPSASCTSLWGQCCDLSMDFFLPWGRGHIPRWQCLLGSNCQRVVQGARGTIFTAKSRPYPHWESLGGAGEHCARWPDSPIISTRSWWKCMQLWMEINVVTLHEIIKLMPGVR